MGTDDGRIIKGVKSNIDGFVEELGCTVRSCIDCGALVGGGPTRCIRCVRELERSNSFWLRLRWLVFGR